MQAHAVDRNTALVDARDDVAIDIQIHGVIVKLLLDLKVNIGGVLWTPLYVFVFEALTVTKTDVLAAQVRDLQETTAALEAQVRDLRAAKKWFEAYVSAQQEGVKNNTADAEAAAQMHARLLSIARDIQGERDAQCERHLRRGY